LKAQSLIVIPCSGRKRDGGDPAATWRTADSAVAHLSTASVDLLGRCRRELAPAFEYPSGHDLGSSGAQAPLMPARKRYGGNLYRQVKDAAWPPPRSSARVVIVSALYGLLTPEEPIREYNLTMGQQIPSGPRLWHWWREHDLPRLLAEYVDGCGVNVVHDFLSGNYRWVTDALYAARKACRVHRHNYSVLGSGADFHRGREIQRLLTRDPRRRS